MYNGKLKEELYQFIVDKYESAPRRDFIVSQYETKPREEFVVSAYQEKERAEFELETKIVQIKKGKIEYKLLFIKTKEGVVKFTIGRHSEELKKVS